MADQCILGWSVSYSGHHTVMETWWNEHECDRGLIPLDLCSLSLVYIYALTSTSVHSTGQRGLLRHWSQYFITVDQWNQPGKQFLPPLLPEFIHWKSLMCWINCKVYRGGRVYVRGQTWHATGKMAIHIRLLSHCPYSVHSEMCQEDVYLMDPSV